MRESPALLGPINDRPVFCSSQMAARSLAAPFGEPLAEAARPRRRAAGIPR